jgi:hypothetical protein
MKEDRSRRQTDQFLEVFDKQNNLNLVDLSLKD